MVMMRARCRVVQCGLSSCIEKRNLRHMTAGDHYGGNLLAGGHSSIPPRETPVSLASGLVL